MASWLNGKLDTNQLVGRSARGLRVQGHLGHRWCDYRGGAGGGRWSDHAGDWEGIIAFVAIFLRALFPTGSSDFSHAETLHFKHLIIIMKDRSNALACLTQWVEHPPVA